jgi:hypothetical protein
MENYEIPNAIIKSIDKRCKSVMISLYIFLTFMLGVATQLVLLVKLFKML